MALDSWLNKVKTAIFNGRSSDDKKVGVLAFEITSLLANLIQLWRFLSDENMTWLRHEAIAAVGVRKLVSEDESFLLSLACAELSESLSLIATSIEQIGRGCHTTKLPSFYWLFLDFSNSGEWVMSPKEMDSAVRRMTQLVTATAALHKAIDETAEMELRLRKLMVSGEPNSPVRSNKTTAELKLVLQNQEVKRLKKNSLWAWSFDSVAMLMARSAFTVLARLKHVFRLGNDQSPSATDFFPIAATPTLASRSLPSNTSVSPVTDMDGRNFLDSQAMLLKLQPSTLGAAALALHYANLIIMLQKMIRSPHLIGLDARDNLYGMLPAGIRRELRTRLLPFRAATVDCSLAEEWREAMNHIMDWLAPLAHNTIRWHNERSFEQQRSAAWSCASPAADTNVLLLQTLVFAKQAKAEAAIMELLVGLNYVWRFEQAMSTSALLARSKLNSYLRLQRILEQD